ncbi:MAG: flippase-like domain-containing protein [Candidatus Zixiibacteriota bacterium]|nr:MAG: flippase-like domain-containing protein [candidate division Zixibacteria bacterium]
MVRFWKKKQFWGGLIGLILLAFCIKDIRLQELRGLLSQLDPVALALSIIASFVFVILRGLRYKLVVSQQSRLPFIRSITLYSAGQALNTIMPALTGQVGRLILFARKIGLRKTYIFSTIILEILFDAISLIIFVLMASLAFPFPDRYRFIGYIIAGATVALLVLLYALLHFQKGMEEFGRRRMRDRWPGAYITVKKFIRSFAKGIETLRSSQYLAGSMIYSLLAWTVHMMAIYFLFLAFGFDISFVGAAVLMIINTLVLLIPITPGNAGTFEVAVSTSLAAFRVGRTDAVLFALALHFIDILPMFVLGLWFVHAERLSLRKISREHEDEVIYRRISEEGAFIEEETV